jgi:hypothetical protein
MQTSACYLNPTTHFGNAPHRTIDQSEVGILNLRSAFEISLRRTSLIAFMNPFDIQMPGFWYHAIDTRHIHILVKIEGRLLIRFGRKKRHKTFPKGRAQPFFSVKNDLFLRTEINNLRSNLTRIWMCLVSIA